MNLPTSDRRTRLPGHLYLTLAEAGPDRAVTTLHIDKTHLAPTGYLHAATAVADAVRALDVSLRPPAEPDLQSVTAMWQRCTLATRLARFHSPVPNLPAAYLDAVRADPAATVVAVHDRTNTVVALASLIRNGSGQSGELGVLVEDAWQRRGIGRRLVTHLVTAAPARGITALTAAVLTEHAQIARLLHQIPGEFSSVRDGLTVQVTVHLT